MITFPSTGPRGGVGVAHHPGTHGSAAFGAGTRLPAQTAHHTGPRRRYLVLVQRRPAGPGLSAPLAERVAAGPCSFHVVVASRPIALTAVLGSAGDPSSGFIAYPDIAEAREQDRLHSNGVLEGWLAMFRGLGLDAGGDVVEVGPLAAVAQTVAEHGAFSEVLVVQGRSAFRHGLASLTGCELTQRLARRVHLPTVRVEP